MRSLVFLIAVSFSVVAAGQNTYIEFRQYEKIQRIEIAAGALYACSKDESFGSEKQIAYQLLHFTLVRITDAYFSGAYRVLAVSDSALSMRVAIVDEHRKIEMQRDAMQKGGYDAVINGEMSCEQAGTFASEVLEYQQ